MGAFMGTTTAKVMLLLILLALPGIAFPAEPYSDAAARTFISLATNGGIVTAKMTYLDITYFHQVNETLMKEIRQKIFNNKDTGRIEINISEINKLGNLSAYNFTASIKPVENASMRFMFEGNNVTDPNGNNSCDKVLTDKDGIARCTIVNYKDNDGVVRAFANDRSCGYVTVYSTEMRYNNASLPTASQTIVICPDKNYALSAFGPAIYSEIGSNLPFCFPAMLIVGLLISAMYYSGRDPLSLFDITMPKLPKTQTFRVKMGTSPQMLRQVTRRYMMVKKQARRDSVREVARLAARASRGDSSEIRNAKKEMNSFYDNMDAKMKGGRLEEKDLNGFAHKWREIMDKYRRPDKDGNDGRFDRSLGYASGLMNTYIQAHQAMKAMGEARGKTSKSWWAKNVSDKAVEKLTNVSLAIDDSKAGRVLGKIPLVNKVISVPTKVLDVAVQLRGSRAALKAARGELIGGVATVLGQTKVGQPIYKSFKRMHVDDNGTETPFAKIYTKITGRSWKVFEDKHDLAKKRLADYYKVADSIRQHTIDSHNRMFDELAMKFLFTMPMRANMAQTLAEKFKLNKEEMEKLGKLSTLADMFGRIKERIVKSGPDGARVAREIEILLGKDVTKMKEPEIVELRKKLDALVSNGGGLSGRNAETVREMAGYLRTSIECEMAISRLLEKRMSPSQSGMLSDMLNIAKTEGKLDARDALFYSNKIAEFGKAEAVLRANLLVYLDKNYYKPVEKDHIKMDIVSGMSMEQLKRKYGVEIERLIGSPEIYRRILEAHAEANKSSKNGLGDAARILLTIGGKELSAEDRALLISMASKYHAGSAASSKKDRADDAKKVAEIIANTEKRMFTLLDDKYQGIKTWVLAGNEKELFNRYNEITNSINDRLKAGGDPVREGCAFGKNPLELILTKALEEALRTAKVKDAEIKEFVYGKDGKPRFTSMDALEQAFKGKVMGPPEHEALKKLLGGSDSDRMSRAEAVMKMVLMRTVDFQKEWSARNYAAVNILHGGDNAGKYMASFASAGKDLSDMGKIKSHMGYLGGEKAFYRYEMGYSDYRNVNTENLIFTARGWEKLSGFIISDKMAGASRGEQMLWLLGAARSDYGSTIERYRVLYNNLVNEKSILHDSKFAEKKAGDLKTLTTAAYEAILARGYTWQDKKNGLELLLSVDKKSTPMLEYNKKYFGEGKDEIIRKPEYNGGKADIRDYAALVARTTGSFYSTREVGFIVLVKQEVKDKDGNAQKDSDGNPVVKWVYGDPLKQKDMKDAQQRAEMQITQRRDIIESVLGMKDGSYDPKNASIRVISVKDFVTYAKDKAYSKEFGSGGLDRAREWLRSNTIYKPGMLAAEVIYSSYNDRLEKMQNWYAAQYQLRQALDRLQHTMQDNNAMMNGKERFKYNRDYLTNSYNNDEEKRIWRHHNEMTDETREAIGKEMQDLAEGKTGNSKDLRKALKDDWHGRIASSILGEIGIVETKLHNARLEMRALERLMETAKKGSAEYNEYRNLRDEAGRKLKLVENEYGNAKNEYMSLNRDIIGWTGSSSNVYIPQRTMWNLSSWNFGIIPKALDSKYVQGTKDAFYQITESSVMRDPRVAIGASTPGWEHSYYVGYHTGQNVYERTRFWATNSSWEKQLRFQTDLAFTVHKWWNDRISFTARYTSGYPAPVKSDMMTLPTYENRTTSDFVKAFLFKMPLQSKTYSDYFRARWQDAVSYTGVGSMLASYQSLGGAVKGDEERSWIRKFLDSRGMESQHYFSTPFRIATQQRYIDQVMAFDDFLNKERTWNRRIDVHVEGENAPMSIDVARARMTAASEEGNLATADKYKKGLVTAVDQYVKLKDQRGRYVRDVFSGSDIQEDGSRNRFLDMYVMFHSNIFTPTIPGMLHASPVGSGEWHTFPQVARRVEEAQDKSYLAGTKHYLEAGYDKENKMIAFTDKYTTSQDAVAEAYKNDVPVLMHLMRMQQKEISYSPINSPSLSYAFPLLGTFGRKLYKVAVNEIPALQSLSSTVEEKSWKSFIPLNHYMEARRQRKEYEKNNPLTEDYRREIYGGRSGGLTKEGEETSEFLHWVDLQLRRAMKEINSTRYTNSPGWRKISEKQRLEYIASLFERN